MKILAIRILSVALIAVASTAIAEPTSQYGGFSPDADSLQIFYDYIHGQEMMKVEAGDELRRAIDAIPVDLGTAIDLEQEAGLRGVPHEFLLFNFM